MRMIWLLFVILLSACTGVPDKVTPVDDFEFKRYLGNWFEIARLDHGFEQGLSDVTAYYARREDGGIRVINRGYSEEDGEWKQAEGKAYFVGDNTVGHLKVSFFGPFYGSYLVFGLDRQNYNYAFVAGPSHDYLWLLSRTPYVSDEVRQQFIRQAEQAGFDTSKLIFVPHQR